MSERDDTQETETGWFHCGRCGALFGALVGGGLPENCPDCGRDPVVDDAEMAFALAAANPAAVPAGPEGAGHGKGRVGAKSRREPAKLRAGSKLMLGVVVVWALLLCGLALTASFFRQQAEDAELPVDAVEERRFLLDEAPACHQQLMGFLMTSTPEERARFVLDPGGTVGKMVRSNEELPVLAAGEAPGLLVIDAIDTPAGKCIEGVWALDDKWKLEAVFRRGSSGDWRLDWELLTRYSDTSWAIFVAGAGPDVGEFRVLARRRTISDDLLAEDNLGVVLLGPTVADPGQVGAASPEILVPRETQTGRAIERAFERRDAGLAAYGSATSKFDPNGMIRLRVRVRRLDDTEKRFEIEEVIATHWLSIDDLGIDLK